MKNSKYLITLTILVLTISSSFGQVGIGTTTPAGALDITSTNDGVLVPRVALTITSSAAPLTTPTTSELIYNTATVADVTPGYYYWDGSAWVRLATGSGSFVETDPQVGALTINRVPKFNIAGIGSLVNGAIIDNAGRVGINVAVAVPNGALEINSPFTADGLIIPRVALTTTTLSAPVATIVESELVYNTSTTGDVTPGFYYWNGSSWLRIATTNNNGWSITGNTGIVDGTNFIGTAAGTNVDVAFRRNNAAAGKIGVTTTSLGVGALSANSGTNNTAFGTNALAANNTPGDNTAIGYNALAVNTLNAGSGNLNTAVGSGSLAALNGGARNTAVGAGALAGISTTASLDNVAVGHNALRGAGTIDQSVALGAGALLNSGGGSTRSTAVGFNAGNAVSQSIENVFIGSNAQGFGPTARNQVVIGYNASANADNTVTLGNTAITALRCAATVITALSDRRDKTEIVKLAEGIEFIKKLKPVSYTWNTRDKSKVGSKAVGFIAQDLLDLQQNSAIGDNLDLVTYNNPDRLEARYGNLLPVIVKGIQEQQELIEALQKSNAELLKANAAILEHLERLEKK
jgi:hypothetical protein